ncbi:hypothetical protein D9619_011400 [Psilocybe cf. subviscida]|uniref:Hydrophobin n=1 Tax=Psilocybe cf. subviscida TaxID=2480587 RepID=A0A8H5BJC0_9AGAR|nr:hypothetical protein D9619_011400 [Psilocybe cf. subviscida]
MQFIFKLSAVLVSMMTATLVAAAPTDSVERGVCGPIGCPGETVTQAITVLLQPGCVSINGVVFCSIKEA